MDFKTQELSGWPQIAKLEVLRQILHYGVQQGAIRAGKHDIIHKGSHEHLDIVFEQGIQPMVGLDTTEAHGGEDSMKGLVPDSATLLEAIERLLKPTDIIWSAHFKSFRLQHVGLQRDLCSY